MPRNGRPAASQRADRLGQAARVEARHRRRRGPDARHDERVGAAERLAVADDRDRRRRRVVSAWSMLTRLPAP